LGRTEQRLRRLVKEFTFAPIRDVVRAEGTPELDVRATATAGTVAVAVGQV